jgi:tubulin beta
LDESGKYIQGSGDEDQQLKRLSVYFQEVGGSQNKYVPRSIQADLEPAVINRIKAGRLSKLFRPDTFIHVSRWCPS